MGKYELNNQHTVRIIEGEQYATSSIYYNNTLLGLSNNNYFRINCRVFLEYYCKYIQARLNINFNAAPTSLLKYSEPSIFFNVTSSWGYCFSRFAPDIGQLYMFV